MSGVSQAVRVANDRSVLLGLLAWQLGLATREHVEASLDVWQQDRTQAFDALLKQRARLSPEQSAWLANVAAAVIRQHGNDAAASLDALGQLLHVRSELSRRIDPEATLDRGLVASSAAPISRPSSTIAAAASTSRFDNLKSHARGGMGEVFIAEDREFARKVALKKIRPEHTGDLLMHQHFQRESQLTGNLEHPGIVPVYSAGRHSDGQPYFAMRLIRGVSLDAKINEFHQAKKHFTSSEFRQLLTQFITVCNTVAYAHSKQILHRDLKPANVMVGDYGETLVVDWGLARGWEQDSAPASEFGHGLRAAAHQTTETESGGIVGTLSYMSPEQAGNRVFSFQPASDIFSLGATFYYLLTGKAPHPTARSDKEREQTLEDIQAGKFPPPRSIRSAIPKPLEAICLKAMALHPDQRYATALNFAADLERYLADEPVSAYREPIPVRIRRWMKHNRSIVASAAVAASMLLAGALIYSAVVVNHNQALTAKNSELAAATASLEKSNSQLTAAKTSLEQTNAQLTAAVAAESAAKVLAESKRVEAERAREETEKVLNTFSHLLSRPNPGRDGESVTVLEVIQQLDPQIERLFPDQPAIQVQLLNVISNTYQGLGKYADAAETSERSLTVALLELGETHEDSIRTMIHLATTYEAQDKLPKSIEMAERAIAAVRMRPGEPDWLTILAMRTLGASYSTWGRHDEAIAELKSARQLMSQLAGPASPETLRVTNDLGAAYFGGERYQEAVGLYTEVLQRYSARAEPLWIATTRANLATAYLAQGRAEEALPLLEQVVAVQETKYGPDHPDTLNTKTNLGSALIDLGRPAEAITLLQEVVERSEQRLGMNHHMTWIRRTGLSKAYLAGGDPDNALPLFNAYIKLLAAGSKNDPQQFAEILIRISADFILYKQFTEAEKLLNIAIPILEEQTPENWELAQGKSLLGESLLGQEKFAESETWLLAGYKGLSEPHKPLPAKARPIVGQTLSRLVALYAAWDMPEKSKLWQAKLDVWKQ